MEELIDFIRGLIPWLAKETGLKIDFNIDARLPKIQGVAFTTFRGAYNFLDNAIAIDVGNVHDDIDVKAVLVHEMTHWLQNQNGLLGDHASHEEIIASERQAFRTTRHWLLDQGLRPEDYQADKVTTDALLALVY